MAEEEVKAEEVTEEVVEEVAEEVAKELPLTADIPYGKGLPNVVAPFMPPFEEITESITYKTQLIARDQKLTSGVNASMPIGLLVGFFFALLMVLVPVFYMT